MRIAIAMNLPSNCQLGQYVLFNPNPGIEKGHLARVCKVNFREGKVSYDLELFVFEKVNDNGQEVYRGSFYDAMPTCDVDSAFVEPIYKHFESAASQAKPEEISKATDLFWRTKGVSKSLAAHMLGIKPPVTMQQVAVRMASYAHFGDLDLAIDDMEFNMDAE